MQKSDSRKVDSASLVDLKAELFRKQEEFRVQKLQSQNSGFIKGKHSSSAKKPSLFSKKNAGVTQRAEKDYEEKVEEENVFERSRKALENKTRLYEQIASSSGISDEDGSRLFLVDFQKKSIDDFEERREKEEMERRELDEEQRQLAEPVPPPDTEEEEWVDYVDAFGRSRRCLKKDLLDLQKQDETLQVKKRKMDEKVQKGYKEFQQRRDKTEDIPNLMSNDMKREMDRQRWEKEEIAKMEEEKQGPIHYSDVQYNEIRTHGVGYYKFDKEENVRQEQMEQLNKLRQETKDERSKSERIKEKRKAALAARLAKVKQRKRGKLGLPEPEHEDGSSEEEIRGEVKDLMKKEPEPLTRDDSWRASVTLTRDWDIGKNLTMERSEEVWLEKQRAEREKEFAPPSFYYDTLSSSKHYLKKDNKDVSGISKSETVNENNKQENEMEAVIEKQLNKIRYKSDFETSAKDVTTEGEIANFDKAENVDKRASLDSDNVNKMQHKNSEPSFDMQSSSVKNSLNVTNIPPPLPNFNVPPPNFLVPPPVYYAPNLNVPHPNINIPPQGQIQTAGASSLPVPQAATYRTEENFVDLNDSILNATSSIVSSKPTQYIKRKAEEKVKRKFVHKLDIIDTRLMGGEGD